MRSKKWIMFLVVAVLVLTGCTSPVISTTQQVPSIDLDELLSPEMALDIQNQVSALLGVPVESIQIVNIEQMEWPDGCLGLPAEGEVCTQAITPGWLLVFSVDGQEFRFRVNDTGTVLRQEPQ
jgi:hypothetical protein